MNEKSGLAVVTPGSGGLVMWPRATPTCAKKKKGARVNGAAPHQRLRSYFPLHTLACSRTRDRPLEPASHGITPSASLARASSHMPPAKSNVVAASCFLADGRKIELVDAKGGRLVYPYEGTTRGKAIRPGKDDRVSRLVDRLSCKSDELSDEFVKELCREGACGHRFGSNRDPENARLVHICPTARTHAHRAAGLTHSYAGTSGSGEPEASTAEHGPSGA
eukprot:6503671-Prymnesium_polylepis.1